MSDPLGWTDPANPAPEAEGSPPAPSEAPADDAQESGDDPLAALVVAVQNDPFDREAVERLNAAKREAMFARPAPAADDDLAELRKRVAADPADIEAADALATRQRVASMGQPPTDAPEPPTDINAKLLAAQEAGDWREVDRLNSVKRARMLTTSGR